MKTVWALTWHMRSQQGREAWVPVGFTSGFFLFLHLLPRRPPAGSIQQELEDLENWFRKSFLLWWLPWYFSH